ncbi:MAG TPA: hypothetical protein VET65_04725 [Candidatus Limnocylindrales bacterium]|nr:hypothetical protein [Candidatus Limnocylindrales bacterium]
MPGHHAQVDGDGVLITAGWQRLRFRRGKDGRLRFESEVRGETGWRAVATIPNTFVQGASFDLAADRFAIQDAGPDALAVWFEGGEPFPWQARVSATPADAFLHVLVTVEPAQPVSLRAHPFLEPWCVLWLGHLDLLRWTQHDAWRQTTIRAPTRSSMGAPGNDLPAAYFYDVAHQAEVCFYADVGRMGWFGPDTHARFRDVEIGPVREPDGRYGVGLHARRRSGRRFPAGPQRFSYAVWQRHRPASPTEREALATLIDLCAPLLGADPPSLDRDPAWLAVSAGTLRALEDPGALITVDGVVGHPAYAPQVGTATPGAIELMTQADVLAPLALHARVDAGARRHADRLAASLDAFWRPDPGVFGNVHPAPSDEVIDSWYVFENALIKLAWIARARQDATLGRRVLDGLARARELAHRCQYLFPLFYDAATQEPVGAGWNVAVNGLYAYACLLADPLDPHGGWADEAGCALRAMIHAPIDLLAHEPQELAFGALAAAILDQREGSASWEEAGRHLLNAQLRMAYWDTDPVSLQGGHDIRGGFQACAGLLYPAFKENVESILPWTGWMRRTALSPLLLRMMDLQRRNNRAFFAGGTPIPYEDVATLELGAPAGSLGREIYGTGEVFWMALLFDTLARSEDPELCVVWLDALDSWDQFPPSTLRLAVFNPTSQPREARLTVFGGAAARPFMLAPGEARRIQLDASGSIATRPSA